MNNIEILAPAGSPEQGYMAIASGCDALYGGLKFGNARKRAKNFTEEEYQRILKFCHRNNVKFYMTLNTLLRTEEVDKIIEKLNCIELPDAVIAADLGLILRLRQSFPELSIHASTQFGASSINEIRFLENIGVERTVLARELTLDEIKNIRNNTDMELEVFVYGSQCILFSGQCLWGGIINESSGNRGSCIGMCRDIYKCGTNIGQFMYPRDIDAMGFISVLEDIGIQSAKIEGRLREPREIANIIENFKQNNCSNSYISYMSNILPVSGMLNTVNPRIKYSNVYYNSYGTHDIVVEDNKIKKGSDIFNHNKCKYIKTVFTQRMDNSSVNVSLKAMFDNSELSKIDFINTFGERKQFHLLNKNLQAIKSGDVCEYIKNQFLYNAYEIISEIPENEVVFADLDTLNGIIKNINDICSKHLNSQNKSINTINVYPDKAVIQTDSYDEILWCYKNGFKKFIYEIKRINDLNKLAKADLPNVEIVYKLPVIDFNDQTDEILKLLQYKHIMITRISQLNFLNDYCFAHIEADYTVNAWNSNSLRYLAQHGVSDLIIHPELSVDYAVQEILDNGIKPSAIVYGRIPLGYTRACFKELGICDRKCNSFISLENINKGYSIEIYCDNDFGIRTVFRSGTDMGIFDTQPLKCIYSLIGLQQKQKNYVVVDKEIPVNDCNKIYRRNVI